MEKLQGVYIPLSKRKALDIKKYQAVNGSHSVVESTKDFHKVADDVRKYVEQQYDKKIEQFAVGESKENYVEIYHNAMQGERASINLLKNHIEDYVVEHGLRELEYPSYYEDLIDALFEESFGWGALSRFRHEPDCEGAQVIGTDISFKRKDGWELQPFKFRNVHQVYELAQRFSNTDIRKTLNEHTSPEIETLTKDGIRVSIMIPGRMYSEPVITLRRKKIESINFNTLAELKTFPIESLSMFEALSKFKANSVIAGAPGSGKSTLLQAFMNEIVYDYDKMGVKIPSRDVSIYVESSPEWEVRKMYPRTKIIHMIGRGQDFEGQIAANILRHDAARVILGEIREYEVGLFKRAGVQGIRQVMGTIHDKDPKDIPDILANLYIQYFPNGSDPQEVKRGMARNLHYSVSMDEFVDEEGVNMKKITSVNIHDVDELTNEPKMYTIMEYDFDNNGWVFRNQIPERFERLVKKYNPVEYKLFRECLSMLEANSRSKVVV